MRKKSLRRIFEKTLGHCHFCGDEIDFDKRGWHKKPNGHWEVDHVIQKHKGGAKSADNCLPACMRCNRLRWHRTGESIRHILLLGIIANKEIRNDSPLGRELGKLLKKRLVQNTARRQKLNV